MAKTAAPSEDTFEMSYGFAGWRRSPPNSGVPHAEYFVCVTPRAS